MKQFLLLCLLCLLAFSNGNKKCEDVLDGLARSVHDDRSLSGSHACRTRLRKFSEHRVPVEKLMLKLIKQSYDFLLMSNHFARDTQERQGFKSYFEKLSNEEWEKAVDLVKYINRRGSHLNVIFNEGVQLRTTPDSNVEELSSLGRALDMEHELTDDILSIHASSQNATTSDPDLSEYMEDMLTDKISLSRELAGHVTALNAMYDSLQKPMALYHFDNMLQS